MATEAEIGKVMRDVFEAEDLAVTTATRLENVPNWDSLTHVQFMLALESYFGVVFTPEEASSARSVADLVALVEKHLAGRS